MKISFKRDGNSEGNFRERSRTPHHTPAARRARREGAHAGAHHDPLHAAGRRGRGRRPGGLRRAHGHRAGRAHRHQRGDRRTDRACPRLPGLPGPASRARRAGRPAAVGPRPAVADIAVDDPLHEVVAKLAHDERQTLADTADALDIQQLAAAVAALASARRIDIYGIGASALVGQDLAQKLLRIGLIAHAHSDPHLAVTNAVQLRGGDAAVAITDSGATGDVIEPLRVAFEHGATTIAMTGRPDGPVTQYADHVLTTSKARESELRPAAMSSRTSQLLVVDCLFIGVAQRTYDTAGPALSASYEALAHRRSARAPGR